ncbi:MAG TPA: hypothetical protein VFO77_08600 [Actinoplanes sp.]|nr:hypothetical protein [Actinoplanes sp.]
MRDVAAITVSSALACWLVGQAVTALVGNSHASWILGRASGIASYLLLVALVATGLVLSHPYRARWHRPSAGTRLRIHLSLAVFTLAFLVLHVVVLATDEYAKVGWWGALLPMASEYRPTAVTLGVLGVYCGLLAGLTAALAGRAAGRLWWPVHKVAGAALILSWLHGVLAGSDSTLLIGLYLSTAAGVLLLAFTRYSAITAADRVRELIVARTRWSGGRR